MGEREEVYDKDIAPLVTQIIKLCQAHKIPMVMSYELDASEDGPEDPLMCTTILFGEGEEHPKSAHLRKAAEILRPKPSMGIAVLTKTDENGMQHITVKRIS